MQVAALTEGEALGQQVGAEHDGEEAAAAAAARALAQQGQRQRVARVRAARTTHTILHKLSTF